MVGSFTFDNSTSDFDRKSLIKTSQIKNRSSLLTPSNLPGYMNQTMYNDRS